MVSPSYRSHRSAVTPFNLGFSDGHMRGIYPWAYLFGLNEPGNPDIADRPVRFALVLPERHP